MLASFRAARTAPERLMTALRNARVASLAAAALLVLAAPSLADPLPHFGPHDVASLFSISKSENKNAVVFGIRLDEQCAPVGDAPVYEFWRMYEKGPHVIEPLLSREQEAYGISSQRVLPPGDASGRVEITLRALPKRPVVVETRPRDGTCEAWSVVTIAGESGYLYNVYVKLRLLGVDFILLSGWATDRTRVLHEKIPR